VILPLRDPDELGDRDARHAVRTRLDETLFVEAGAGTGKTDVLVDRIVALVTEDGAAGPIDMRTVAAITFTEKAAAELRDRVRRRLEARAQGAEPDSELQRRSVAALDELDAAAICTLHAFAQRILTAFPVEAGLPPRIEVHDEVSSLLTFDARWRHTRDDLLDDPALEPAVLALLGAGGKLEHLRRVAEFLDDNWDLLDRIGDPPPLPALELDAWFAELDAAIAEGEHCRDADDNLLERLDLLGSYAQRIRDAVDDAARIELLLADKPSFKVSRCGSSKNWPDINAVRDRIIALDDQRRVMCDRVTNAALRQVVAFLAARTAENATLRRHAGELEFHDLLVLARAVLRDPAHGRVVRRRLRARYQRLLVDEFQDTDPIQVDIAALLAAADDDPASGQWNEVNVEAGRLFFVGDPKQSIYRFRRADIATFLAARDRFADSPLRLTSNFRSTEVVMAWINHVFGDLIQPAEGSQPDYFPLEARRASAPSGPGVLLLGSDCHEQGLRAGELREREAASVAAAIRTAIDECWQVGDGAGGWRDAQLGDVCVLLPARTSLPFLERALEAEGISYRAETSSLVYATREVRDLLMVLRAIDDPSDQLSLVSALRSPLFGCGDDDLFEFHVEHGGRWDVRLIPPATLPTDHPVVDALRSLRDMHHDRTWVTPSELLERVVRERHVLELGADSGKFRDVSRRIRFVVDQARAFSDAAGGSLRDYLAWATLQGTEGARVVETVLPETDDDAVRIMTIHGAKGLQFPIVVCSGTTTQAAARLGGVQVLFPATGGYEVSLSKRAHTDAFELHQAFDEQMSFHEKLRLLYVACTRARDHLVVSVHRAERANAADPSRRTLAELLHEASAGATASTTELVSAARAGLVPASALAPPDLDTWIAEHEAAFATGARRRVVSATALARFTDDAAALDPGVAKEGRDLELPPWNKGRYGTAIGRAVHAVLQTVDLTTGAGLADLAAAQAAAEGVLGYEATIAALVSSAISSPSIEAACASEYWRETYVAVPVEGLTLEGYVDLVYRDADAGGGLVVVDYKTDAIRNEGDLTARLAHYRVQGAAYAIAVSAATGERVDRCVFLFLSPDAVREVVIGGDELAGAIADVRVLIRSVRDSPPPLGPVVLADA
jgi:ATP-dependent exoDNAse (exonuclease V) beta subunit